MDEWENVRKKLRELEGSIFRPGLETQFTRETVSVADFWKRRYEEEKAIWERALEVKEREQSEIHDKFLRDEQGIRELNYKLRELEQRLLSEKAIWEERSKVKHLETALEKKKVEWENKILLLSEEIELLRIKLQKGPEPLEDELKSRRQFEADRAGMEAEMKRLHQLIETASREELKKIDQIENEKHLLHKQIDDLIDFKNEGKEKSSALERELALLSAERNSQLETIREREKEHLLAYEDLTRGFAQKIRNQLNIVSGTLQSCAESFNIDKELQSHLKMVDETSRQTKDLIDEFLSLARIPQMNLETLTVKEILERAVARAKDSGMNGKVHVEIKSDGDLPRISADRDLLTDAVRQLVLNAIEATGAGEVGGAVTVSAAYTPSSGKITLRILDHGIGIPDRLNRKVFEPYFTTKKGRKGLGLAFAKRAVELHHGSLTLSRGPERGTAATIHLPVQKHN